MFDSGLVSWPGHVVKKKKRMFVSGLVSEPVVNVFDSGLVSGPGHVVKKMFDSGLVSLAWTCSTGLVSGPVVNVFDSGLVSGPGHVVKKILFLA